jgi:RimJ/RimL family protein N-acetyltransferase
VVIHGGIEFDNEEHGRIIGGMAPCPYDQKTDKVISRTVDRAFVGGVVYQDFISDGSIAMHAGARSPRWWNKELAWVVFAYPLLQLKVRVCLITVLNTNVRSLRFCRGIGFRDEHVIPDAAPGGGVVLLSMRLSHCRWLTGPAPKGFLARGQQ